MIETSFLKVFYLRMKIYLKDFLDRILPLPRVKIPEIDLGADGIKTFLSEAGKKQVLFVQFEKDIELAEHAHDDLWGLVVDGKMELTMNGTTQNYHKGDQYHIPEGVKHSTRIYEGYAEIIFFEKEYCYEIKNRFQSYSNRKN